MANLNPPQSRDSLVPLQFRDYDSNVEPTTFLVVDFPVYRLSQWPMETKRILSERNKNRSTHTHSFGVQRGVRGLSVK